MRSNFATPGEQYLARIGELAYAVSSLEWTLLGDLSVHKTSLPDDLTLENLAGHTTGRIATLLDKAIPKVEDSELAVYLEAGSAALRQVAELRNAVLHARPATIDGEQRLRRYRATPHEAFAITDAWLEDALDRIAQLSSEVHAVRPAFWNAVEEPNDPGGGRST